MNKKLTIFVLLAGAFFIAAVGCTRKNVTATDPLTTEEGNPGWLIFDSLGIEKKDQTAEISYSIEFPVKGNQVLVDSIRHYIVEMIGVHTDDMTDGNKLLETALNDKYKKMKEERDNLSNDVEFEVPPFEYDFQIDVLNETDHYITLSTAIYEYVGGVHGGAFGVSTSFNKENGQRMGYNMLKDTSSKEFMKLVKEGLYDYFSDSGNKITTDTQLAEMLLVEGGVSQLPLPVNTPWLTEEGVVFCYQQYEIAPYAAGMPAFVIPYEKIRPFLTDEALTILKQ